MPLVSQPVTADLGWMVLECNRAHTCGHSRFPNQPGVCTERQQRVTVQTSGTQLCLTGSGHTTKNGKLPWVSAQALVWSDFQHEDPGELDSCREGRLPLPPCLCLSCPSIPYSGMGSGAVTLISVVSRAWEGRASRGLEPPVRPR